MRFLTVVGKVWQLSRGAERPFTYHMVYLAEACLVLRWLKDDHVTHVHAHFGTNATTVALLIKAIGGPSFSFTVHGPEEFDNPLNSNCAKKFASRTLQLLLVNSDGANYIDFPVLPTGIRSR